MSLFWSKLFSCLCPAEYWVWYQLLALLLTQPGRCWDVHSTGILQTYDIYWFQVICTIFFPSSTSKYVWSVSNNNTSSLKILQCSRALLNDLFSVLLSVKGSTDFQCINCVTLRWCWTTGMSFRAIATSSVQSVGRTELLQKPTRWFWNICEKWIQEHLRKFLLYLLLEKGDMVKCKAGHRLYPQHAWHCTSHVAVNTWVLYLLNRDRGKEPKLLMVLYVQNLQVKLFEKQICHSEGIMIIDYQEQLGDKVCYAHQCRVPLASLWTSLSHQSVRIKQRYVIFL